MEEAIQIVNEKPKPLALYIFSNDKKTVDKIISETSSGGVCVNDTMMHVGEMWPFSLPINSIEFSKICSNFLNFDLYLLTFLLAFPPPDE